MSRNWRFLLVFTLGVAVGAAVVSLPRLYHPDPKRKFERFSAELKLRTEQKPQLAAILEESRRKVDSLRAEYDARFEAIRGGTDTQIRPLLDADQVARFEKMRARWEERHKKKAHPGGGW